VKRALLLLAVLVCPAASQAVPQGGTPVALVTSETQNRLVAVELPSGRILKRLPMPVDPENVEANGTHAVVVSARGGAVTILGVRRLRVLRVLHGFALPHIPLVVPGHEIAYVTDDARGQLAVIDLVRKRVTRRVYVGLGAHHMAISPDGSQTWVALGERARWITILDTKSPGLPRVIGRMNPRGEAHDLGFSPDGTRVWVTYDDRSSVAIFDARARRRVRVLPAGAPPQHVGFDQLSAARHAYVTSGDDGTLRIVSLRRLRTLRTLSVARGSFNVWTDGSLVLTSSLTNGTLTELDGNGHLLLKKRVAPAARDVALVDLP
jgi:DNA-binding beta-propeller fold protein YncE